MENPSNITPADLPGETPIDRAVYALTFCGALEISEIPRWRAARLLDCWAGRGELSDAHVDAVLDRFPEGEEAADDEPYTFSTMVEAYRLGEMAGHHKTDEDMALVARLDRKLKDAETAYADGYTDGLAKAYDDDPALHAFTVQRADSGLFFRWVCRCGWDCVQLTTEVPAAIQERLIAHARGEETAS